MADLGDLGKITGRLGKRIVVNTNRLARQTALQIDSILVGPPQEGGTPVDTGRARSNWLTSLGSPRQDTVAIGDRPDPKQVVSQRRPQQTIFIANNLPYIRRLNEGSSTQAPASFVEMAVAEGERIIRKGKVLR